MKFTNNKNIILLSFISLTILSSLLIITQSSNNNLKSSLNSNNNNNRKEQDNKTKMKRTDKVSNSNTNTNTSTNSLTFVKANTVTILGTQSKGCKSGEIFDNSDKTCKADDGKNLNYVRQFTSNLCINTCGKVHSECSCDPSCKLTGTCCSDYYLCNGPKESKIQSCKVSFNVDPNTQGCFKCDDGKYLTQDKKRCVDKCEEGSVSSDNTPLKDNKICFSKDVLNVKDCVRAQGDKCAACIPGHLLDNEKCVETCPEGSLADRKQNKCIVESSIAGADKNNIANLPIFTIHNSDGSCVNNCGKAKVGNCSCEYATCSRKGNCCNDIIKASCKKN